MNVTTTTSQAEALCAMAVLGIKPEQLVSRIPGATTDSIMQLNDTSWLIITNDNGRYTLHCIENATSEEAWKYHRSLCQPGYGQTNPRLEFVGGKHQPPANN